MILDVKVQEVVSLKHKYVMGFSTVLMDQMNLIAVSLNIYFISGACTPGLLKLLWYAHWYVCVFLCICMSTPEGFNNQCYNAV